MRIFNVFYNIVSIVIVAVFIFTLGLKFTDTKVYAVATPSMKEELFEGDMVFVRTAGEYLEGDIITANLPSGGTFTHRIISVDNEKKLVYTMGDNNPQPDPLPTAFDDIVGKVVFSVPMLGNLALKFEPVTVMVTLAVVLVALMVIRFIVYRFKNKKEAEAV